ncbi:MAG: hypothetical protein R2731_14025 [Nocardioides sp.]
MVALSLASCGRATDGAMERYDSGLRGLTWVDGGCPVVREGEDCPAEPLAAVVVVTRVGDASPYAEITSDDGGSYELRLPPGDYVVSGRARNEAPLPILKPQEVTVSAHQFLALDLYFDSGIR